MESLLRVMLADIERNTALQLFPTYSFFRIYKSGDVLPNIEIVPHAR